MAIMVHFGRLLSATCSYISTRTWYTNVHEQLLGSIPTSMQYSEVHVDRWYKRYAMKTFMDSSTNFQALPKRIFFDLVIRFNTNRKYAFFCIF